MNLLRTTFLLFSFLFSTHFSFTIAQSNNEASMPFDMVFIGYDNNLGGSNSEKIGILTMIDIAEGYTFGIVNMIKNSSEWESFNNDKFIKISFKLKSGYSLKKGTLLEIKNFNGTTYIFSNNINISNQFEINGLTDPSYRLLKTSGSYLTLYSGYLLTDQKFILFGTILDALSINVSRLQSNGLSLDPSLDGKEVFTTDDPNHGGGSVDIQNCRLCDILLLILNPDNWIFAPGTQQDDVDLSDFNIEDCAEVDCDDGVLSIDTINNAISMTQSPCSREIMSYKWQKLINGIYVTIDQGNGPYVPPYELDPKNCVDEQYRLIIICNNECEYSETFEIECIPECEMSFYVVQDGCTLTAFVEGCAKPDFEWWYLESGNSKTPKGNTPSITGEEDGNYYVVISGCDDCDIKTSPYYLLKGCKDCNCTQEGELDSCTIVFETSGCKEYIDLWEYSINGVDNWTSFNFHGETYVPSIDGFYRRTLINKGCEDIDTIIPVNCLLTCDDFTANYNVNQECQIEIDYTGCLDVVDIQISYALNNSSSSCDSNLVFVTGGGYIYDDTNNGLSGTIVIEPEFENTCYLVTLICDNGCTTDVFIYNEQCCQGNLMIEEDECIIYTSNIPCSGTFTYTWFIDGIAQQPNTGQSVPPLTPLQNVTYRLEIVCSDGCLFPSNNEQITCIDPPCDSEVSIIPDGCLMTATVSNCPNAQFQWQIDTGNGFVNISGETGQTYIAISDDPLKIIVGNCANCDTEEIYFIYTPMGCDDMCDCETEVWVDDDCILQSSDTYCAGIKWISWWKSDDGGNSWYNFPGSEWQTSFVPPSNGMYKKLIEMASWTGCPDVEDIAIINCLEDCDNVVTLTPTITDDCYLKVTWEGCYDFDENDIGWYFTGSNNCPSWSGTIFPTTLPPAGTVVEYENNPMEGTGHLIVEPDEGPGCYFFNFQCAGCEVQQTWIEWEECCEDCVPEFEYTYDCQMAFESIIDEECYNLLISQGYIPKYNFASGGFSYIEITEQEYFDPSNTGWYKIVFTNSDCESIETPVVFVDNFCSLEGTVHYDCINGITFDISGGVGPYTYKWGADLDYPSLVGNQIFEGDYLPYNLSMPITVTDSEGTSIFLILPFIDCPCQNSGTLYDGKTLFKVDSWKIYQNGVVNEFFGDWSDNFNCNSPNSSTDLENDIINFVSTNCISIWPPDVDITISAGQVSLTAEFDAYCGIQQIELVIENCYGRGLETLSVSFNCYSPRPEITSTSELPENKVTAIQIFPNPTRDNFTVSTSDLDSKYLNIKIYNTQGQLVKEVRMKKNSQNEYHIQNGSIKPGLYYVWVESDSGIIGYEKLIIIK